jgi:NhaP-type Na+/H+ or K+/H+ antiporter
MYQWVFSKEVSMGLEGYGALCFGLVIGWVTHRTLRRTKSETTLADISAVIAAVGGAAVTALFKVGAIFGAYSIGLAIGFFAYFIIAMIFRPKNEKGEAVDPESIDLLGNRIKPRK